ncbi:MAG: hypothetical protein RML94_00655 [Bacteroidia bacterium]|nr:hypothetical protein [Bacteroidia bacterium]
MKKSKLVKLVLVASLFVSCKTATNKSKKVYFRADSTGTYTQSYLRRYSYFVFYPYSTYNAIKNIYEHRGYHNNLLSRRSSSFYRYRGGRGGYIFSSNYGKSNYGGSTRGGFGGGGSSSS